MRWILRGVCICSILASVACVSKNAIKRDAVSMGETIPETIAKSYEVTEKPKVAAGVAGKVPTVLPEEALVAKPRPSRAKGKKETATQALTPAPSVVPNRRPPTERFRQGERVLFDVTWLKSVAGELGLEVLPLKYIEGRKVYHFRGTARTTSLVAAFYKAEDWVESFVDFLGLFPYKYVLHGDESKHIRDNLELFDHVKAKQYVYIKDDRLNGEIHEDKGIKDLTPFSQDSMSSLFYIRLLKLEDGKPETMSVATGGHMSDMKITALGREDVRTKAGTFRCIKTNVQVNYKREKTFNENHFWFTDDDRRLLVKFEAKVRIGWLGGVAKSVDLGVPFSAE